MGSSGGGAGGMPNFGDGSSYSYTYHGDPRATFTQFFGGSNPFESFFSGGPGNIGSSMGPEEMDIDIEQMFGGFGGGNIGGMGGQKIRKQQKAQDPPIEKEVFVNIEEIATGCEKKMKISRKVYKEDGSPELKSLLARKATESLEKSQQTLHLLSKTSPILFSLAMGSTLNTVIRYLYGRPSAEQLFKYQLWTARKWVSIVQEKLSSQPRLRG